MKKLLPALLLTCSIVLPATAQTPSNPLVDRASRLNQEGTELLAKGNANRALTMWEQANKIYTQVKDTEGIVGTQINQAQALQSLGFYRQASISLQTVNTKLQQQPNSPLKMRGLYSLGTALKSLRVLEKKGDNLGSNGLPSATAIDTLKQALTIAESIGDRETADKIKLSLGNTIQLLGVDRQPEAIELYQQLQSSTLPLVKVQAQINLYKLQSAQNIAPNALGFVDKIGKELGAIEPSRKSIYAYVNLAETIKNEQKNSQPDRQILLATSRLLTTAIGQARNIKDHRAEAQALGELGNLYELTSQHSAAKNLTKQALVIAEGLPAPDLAYRLHWQLGRIISATNPQDLTPAIAAYRQSVNHLKSLRNDLNGSDADLQFSFRDSVEPVYRELVDLLLKDDEKNVGKNLTAARDLIESLQVAELENFLRQGCLDTYTVQLDKIDRSAAIVYSIVLPDRVAVLASIPGQPLRYYSNKISQQNIEENITKIRSNIENPEFTPRQEQAFQTQSKQLYDLLIAPLATDLQKSNTKTLVFVSDGVLRNLPMSVLYDGKQYLVEKYNLALTPGLQLVPPSDIGDSDNRQALLGGISESRQGFASLPGVKTEIEAISKLIPNQQLINEKFNNRQVASNLVANNSQIVHLATHGQFSSKPEDTFILTWDNRLGIDRLQNLIQSRNIRSSKGIDLLVLSACQTAAGDNRATLGLAGVAIKARAKSTIASLWSVSDEGTQLLMTDLYKNLATPSLSKAESLKLAQQSLIRNPKYRSPFYWGAFILVGNWR
jgi:CHAT domain-containing protein